MISQTSQISIWNVNMKVSALHNFPAKGESIGKVSSSTAVGLLFFVQ